MKLLLLPLGLLAACQAAEGPPRFAAGVEYLTQYNFRGTPQTSEGAFHVDATGECDFEDGSQLVGQVFTSWDASDDVGESVRVGGQGGEVTELRLQAVWRKTYDWTTVTAGAVAYDYPGRVRPATTELILGVGWESAGWETDLTLYHDVDEIKGSYLAASVGRRFLLQEKLHLDTRVGVGFTDGDHGLDAYGTGDGGAADALAAATLDYALDERTTLSATLATSTILRTSVDDALAALGVGTDYVWFGFGVTWGF